MSVPQMSEPMMQAGIMRLAKQLGYLAYHTKWSLNSPRGFPDLVIVGHGRSWFLEIKGPRPKVYPEQIAWVDALGAVGHDARFIHPGDYEGILQELMDAYSADVTR
jgi:hypothetical protein